jgi:hypothetical protein
MGEPAKPSIVDAQSRLLGASRHVSEVLAAYMRASNISKGALSAHRRPHGCSPIHLHNVGRPVGAQGWPQINKDASTEFAPRRSDASLRANVKSLFLL